MTEETQQNLEHAFGALREHADEYKTYVRALRRGNASGISGILGRPAELLPSEFMEEYDRDGREAAVGVSVLDGNASAEKFRSLVEELIASPVDDTDDEIIGFLFDEDGNKEELLADFSTRTIVVQEGSHDEPDAIQRDETESSTMFSEFGIWLWTIRFDQGRVKHIEMSDGRDIFRTTESDKYVIMGPALDDGGVPVIQVIAGIFIEEDTGNLYLRNVGDTKVFAFFNNGWRVEQERHADQDLFWITPPQMPGEPAQRMSCSGIEFDSDNCQFTYDTEDGASRTIGYRKLETP
jgi:hypothetical protein